MVSRIHEILKYEILYRYVWVVFTTAGLVALHVTTGFVEEKALQRRAVVGDVFTTENGESIPYEL